MYAKKLSLFDYKNILLCYKINNFKNIKDMKQKAVKILTNKMCKCYTEDDKYKRIRLILCKSHYSRNNKNIHNNTYRKFKHLIQYKNTKKMSPIKSYSIKTPIQYI
jgi:hypothetical protein